MVRYFLVLLASAGLIAVAAGAAAATPAFRAAGRFARWVRRAFVSAWAALAAAILVGMIAGQQGYSGVATGLVAALFVFPGTMQLLAWRERRRHRNVSVPRHRAGQEPARPATPAGEMGASAPGDPAVDSALARLAPLADWGASRIAVVRTSYMRLFAHASANPLDQPAAEWAAVVRQQAPGLVAAALADHSSCAPSEQRLLLEELVDSLERLAAEADRRRGDSRSRGTSDFAIRRVHVARRTERDPFES